MLQLSKEKLVISLQRLTLYLSVLEKGPVARKQDVIKLHKYAVDILSDVMSGQTSLEEGIEQYQDLVVHINALLTSPTYPKLNARSLTNLLRADVIAFENYLVQQLLAGNLNVVDQKTVFDMSAEIWNVINQDSVKDVIQKFGQIVSMLNTKLPSEQHYPIPDLAEYPLDSLQL